MNLPDNVLKSLVVNGIGGERFLFEWTYSDNDLIAYVVIHAFDCEIYDE